MDLIEYVQEHSIRGECACGQCCDRGDAPEPAGHTVSVEFFAVALRGQPTRADFEAAARAHRGDYMAVDVFDGNEHNYITLGAWIGDQGLALQFMGLGALVGAFKLITPSLALPGIDQGLSRQLAASGLVAVVAER